MVVFYQPILDLRSRTVVRGEALCRFPESPPELKNPDDFITYAENHGLVKGLTEWLLATTLSYWKDLGELAPASLSLNFSPQNLLEVDLSDRVLASLERYGIAPSRLWLELDERLLKAHDAVSQANLKNLAAAGVHVAIDGFGPSLSPVSLMDVKSMPITELKLDRALVMGLADDPNARARMKAISDLARDAGAELAAKGIEDEAVVEWLVHYGMARVQGYYVAAPMSADDFRNWLAERRPPPTA
ncbi:MAG: EAL domain-containing protein [Candidatus Eremiobacteraeota bacterium]|nr:EAL domain-containing protein [Candidatus Eremiobacteraeota bacterium]